MNASKIPVLALCSGLLFSLSAQSNPALPPELADWDAFMAQQLALWKVPGASIAIVKDGQVILSRGYGLRDVAQQLPMTENTVQPIASTTKSFTVAALATLVRDGKLKWDEPVREYLPDFRLHSDYATQTVTLRDMVSHRTGLPRHDAVWFNSKLSREELIKRVRHFELSAEPRARFQYNNLMYMTAGYVGGKVAGSSWEGLVREQVLSPLGMKSTNFSIADLLKAPDHGTGYALDNEQAAQPKPYVPIDAMGPTGSLNSNAKDMSQYLLMLTADGKFKDKTLIQSSDLRAMTTGQMALPDPRQWPEVSSPQYGMGWFVGNYRGVTLVNHGGNMPGAATALGFVPGRNIGVYTTVNIGNSALRDVILYAAMDRLLGLPPVDWSGRLHGNYLKGLAAEKAAEAQKLNTGKPGTQPAFALSEYAGEYEHPGYGIITVGGGSAGLELQYNGLKAALPHWHYEVFQTPRDKLSELSETRVQFVSNFEGDVDGLRIEFEPSVKPALFKRLPDKRFKDPAFLAKLVGVYAIGTNEMHIVLRPDGVLTAGGRTGAPNELVGLRGTRFEVKSRNGNTVEFLADASGRYTQLALRQNGSTLVAERRN
ncbi:serine hydrolase [Paucibacter sp. DJ2R-2]|uniref:serine hydrolase n=1 Tax=Paucibacter sp. DJ2R-2 TaxID=2893558 RepID=UPI0021E4A2EE|nr:serine hydrolase [Paucibacter sp. DJ2R-2]MCV2420065.1 serine hydrolase [Paucibacter sp. DJ4R-1]MCV2437008.1 serine hydrolase [Paucibacter sp. DJ2R-2]